MKSYIKIYGPPLVEAFRALEKIAAEMPEVLISSFFHPLTPASSSITSGDAIVYFDTYLKDVPEKRRTRLISKSGHTLGENDFYFEWAKDPRWKELETLISKIDKALAPLGCKYTITTK
jgi:hypothetical protein